MHSLSPDHEQSLERSATFLQQHPEAKIAIVSQGGGLAGAHGVAVLDALVKAGLEPKDIDLMAASSASAGTSAFFCSGQFAEGKRIWSEGVTDNDRFLQRNPVRRLIQKAIACRSTRSEEELLEKLNNMGAKHTIMDATYLVEELFGSNSDTHPVSRDLDTESLAKAHTRLIIPTTIGCSRHTLYWCTQKSMPDGTDIPNVRVADDVRKVLIATKSVPGLAAPVNIDGSSYTDGSYSCVLPITHPALSEPDTFTIVISTQPEEQPRFSLEASKLGRAFRQQILRIGVGKQLAALLSRCEKQYFGEILPLLKGRIERGSAIAFHPKRQINPLDNRKETIESVIRESYANTLPFAKQVVALVKKRGE